MSCFKKANKLNNINSMCKEYDAVSEIPELQILSQKT